jgi:endoglucanase
MRQTLRLRSAIDSTSLVRLSAGLMLAISAAACSSGDSITAPDASTTGTLREAPSSINPVLVTGINPVYGTKLWINPYSNAQMTANAWRTTRPADAAAMDKVASGAQALWFGNWNSNVQSDVANAVTQIVGSGALPVLVAYNIPQRDCGGLSGGNATTTYAAYRTWITAFANGIGSRKAAVILEPDALAAMDCLSSTDQSMRLSLLTYAAQVLRSMGNVSVYIDAGHPGWRSAPTMASRLMRAGVSYAQGFALNVSNFIATSDNITYGKQISSYLGGKHFIIDTGRNGLGPTADYQWCNPAGRGLGLKPTTVTNVDYVDAYLWVKPPGESDGACNGGPAAGSWYADYALGLGQRAIF